MADPGKTGGAGAQAWRVEFKGLRSRESMLRAAAAALSFPAHFGANLDALYDCLTDMALETGRDYAITLAALPHSPDGDAVYTVFADAAEAWRDRGVRVTVVRA